MDFRPDCRCGVAREVCAAGESDTKVFVKDGPVQPDGTLKLWVNVEVDEADPTPRTLTNVVSVEGGGLGRLQATGTNTLEMGPPVFGLDMFSAPLRGVDGLPDSRAGGHPYGLEAKFDLNSVEGEWPEGVPGATCGAWFAGCRVRSTVGCFGCRDVRAGV